MPDYESLTIRFKALAHPVRLQMLDMLRRGETCVCHFEAVLGKRQAYVSQQLMALREAGLVTARRDGLRVYYRLTDDVARAVLDAALGPLPEDATFERHESCPCPVCTSTIAPDSISVRIA